MQNILNMSFVQDYVLTCESIFFKKERIPVEYSRINADYKSYDCEYERAVRRKELDQVLLLEEILHTLELADFKCSNTLADLEDLLFSPDFYRGLIFIKDIYKFKAQYHAFCGRLKRNIDIFERKVSNANYRKISDCFEYLSPAPNKEEFIDMLKKIHAFFLSKKEVLEKMNGISEAA